MIKLSHIFNEKLLKFISLSAVIILFFWPFVISDAVLPSDWDYFAQAYEAARKSIVEYHQFPWWNAWHMGGIPLYANPQFGTFSIQMLLVMLFGTLSGLKVSILLYALVGFWGMRQLLIKLKTNQLYASLLAYIWIFSAFPMWHFSVGHFTFTTYFLAPWLFHFLLDIHTNKHNWIYVSLVATLAVQSSFHYTTIQLFILASGFALLQILMARRNKTVPFITLCKPYAKMLLLFLIINSHRIYYVLDYLRDYPRIPAEETRTPISLIYTSLTFRGDKAVDTIGWFGTPYAWHEYAAYCGIITIVLFSFLVIHRLLKTYKLDLFWVFTILGFCAFVLALGPFFKISPYSLLKALPGLEQMQVASRWLGWFVFCVIVSLHALPRRKLIMGLLVLSLLDVSHSSYGVISKQYPFSSSRQSERFEQYAYFINDHSTQGRNLRLFYATHSNVGEVYGYEPILGFGGDYNEAGYDQLTLRCGVNQGCPLVLTGNAHIKRWSPHVITLERTAPGNIELNMNPGNRWAVNGKKVFENLRILELNKPFMITDSSDQLIVTFR